VGRLRRRDSVHRRAPTIICFGFDSGASGPAPDEVIQVMRHAASLVGQAGLTLALEPHSPSAHVADLVRRVGHPALGLNWDPANSYSAGEDMPFPDGYAYVRGLVRHVHFKDARQDPLSGRRTWTISDGVIDWAGAIAALHADGYEGYISVETHVRPKIDGSRRTLARVQGLVADATRELALTGAGRAGSVP
jgi:L-ribulose-5-phosphate 3-epimerase